MFYLDLSKRLFLQSVEHDRLVIIHISHLLIIFFQNSSSNLQLFQKHQIHFVNNQWLGPILCPMKKHQIFSEVDPRHQRTLEHLLPPLSMVLLVELNPLPDFLSHQY